MITALVILSGLALFQLLIAWEAYWQIRNDVMRWTAIPWFVLPKEERSYMVRTDGVQTMLP